MDASSHWESVYQAKAVDKVSWYRPRLEVSLELLERGGLNSESRVIDIGAGASTLIDDLLKLGVRDLSALDVSESSLQIARQRLGAKASSVRWIVGDVTAVRLPEASIDLWHDRAALHFLTSDVAVRAYVDEATQAIADEGHAVIGCFAADGPTHCSGLPVMRRDPEDIAALFARAFKLVESRRETHVTPSGSEQRFAYVLLRKR